jgi:hypothetical protein
MGIIDFLQKYNKRKRLETKWLTMKHGKVDHTTFSCVHPNLYADRFHKFMVENLFEKHIQYRPSVITPQYVLHY